jgi:hypothetical protein
MEALLKVCHIIISRRGETGLRKRPSSGFLKCVKVEMNCFLGSNIKHENTTLYDALNQKVLFHLM